MQDAAVTGPVFPGHRMFGKEIEVANWMAEPPGLFMGRGCIAEDTIVMTSAGPKYASEIAAGDLLATHHGSDDMFFKSVASVARQGSRPVSILRTRTHAILATGNHPFLALRVEQVSRRNEVGRFTKSRNLATLRWTKLSELKRGDYVVIAKRYKVPGTRKFSNVAKTAGRDRF